MSVEGQVDARFGPVRECFAEVVAGQAGTGAAFAAWCDGQLVADLWGGRADLGRHRPWQADSLVQPYSVSKPFAALCALRLVEAGRLDLDAPVQRYWPQFRAPVTVRHVLSHQAGVVALDQSAPTEAFYDWDWLCALLATQEPSWEPGTAQVFGDDNAWGLGFGLSDGGYGMGGLGGSYGGTCTTGGYIIGSVTGTVGSFDRVDALEATLRTCLGLPPLPPLPPAS